MIEWLLDSDPAIRWQVLRDLVEARAVVAGAGHEIQFAGPPVNEVLLATWRTRGQR